MSFINLSNNPFKFGSVFLALPFEVLKPQCCLTCGDSDSVSVCVCVCVCVCVYLEDVSPQQIEPKLVKCFLNTLEI